ncbi:MAG TPA: hypothetical protein VKA43_10130 [Gammaproteobacteria bacterium]|nr:hypothetical protein [Gammaproteobacteria bacterium]
MVRAALLLLSVTVAGCALGGRDAAFRPAGGNGATAAPTARSAEALAIYLDALRDLLEGDAVVQADVFRSVAAAADSAPTTTNRLRLALALATPTHAANDPVEAQRLLNELLASGSALLPEEHTLALIHLKDVEQRLILDAEAERLQRAATAAAAQRNDRNAQQLQAALEENRQLRAALDEARAKLDAITNIERSIRERENGPNSQ